MADRDYDEWIKQLPTGYSVKYSCQLLTSGFSASAEIVDPVEAAMVYTYTCTDRPAPAHREEVEEQFAKELTNANVQSRSAGSCQSA
jgi:hypothetical protein